MDTVGEGVGETNGESSIETHTLPYIKRIASGNLLSDTGSSNLVLCDNLEGWDRVGSWREVQQGRDTHTHPYTHTHTHTHTPYG